MDEMSCGEDFEVVGLFSLPWHDVIFPHLFTYLPIQTIFKLRGTCRMGCELVREYFSVAKEINIARIAGRINSNAFQTIMMDNTYLVRLNLRNSKDWLTDGVLCPVFKENPKLQFLDLTNCMGISNSSMQVLAIKCQQLRTLILRDCHWLSVEGLNTLALNLEHLEKVDLSGCWNVNDDSVILVALNCKMLQSITLSKIYGLTDRSVSVLARVCRYLNHLNIQGCWRITDESVRFLGEYCKSLKMLQIRECHSVTERTLTTLRENKVKMDVHPPPSAFNNSRMDNFSRRLRNRLNLQI